MTDPVTVSTDNDSSLVDRPDVNYIIESIINSHPDQYKQALANDSAIQGLTNLCVQYSGKKLSPLSFSLALRRRIERDRNASTDYPEGSEK